MAFRMETRSRYTRERDQNGRTQGLFGTLVR